jgi:hypothetical protein
MSLTTIASPEEIKKVNFPGQYADEKILLVKRRHWIVLLGFGLTMAVLCFVPFFVLYFLPIVIDIPNTEIFQKLFWFATYLYYLCLTIMSFFTIIDYYLDIWIITTQRIVSVEQRGLFHRIVIEVRYSQIQDITSNVSGLIPTYFQFGDVRIQTAAEEERMVLKQITHPVDTRRIISDAYHKEMEDIEGKKSPAL